MGSKGRPVLVYLQKTLKPYGEPEGSQDGAVVQASEDRSDTLDDNLTVPDTNNSEADLYDYKKVFISEGFKTMMEIKETNSTFGMGMAYDSAGWTAVFSRLLTGEYADFNATGVIPVAFAVWDGAKMGRADIKNLSSWIAVNLKGRKGDKALVKELTTKPKGDAAAGKVLVESQCSSCHRLNAENSAVSYKAPDLSNVGGYATVAYLRESIIDPSAVIVPEYNRSMHKKYPWYSIEGNGTRVSIMPPMQGGSRDENSTQDTNITKSSRKDIDNIVAYLSTLKAEVQK
jgi:complex iron-sulfur molybdoenzyme family reductase subunit gamma